MSRGDCFMAAAKLATRADQSADARQLYDMLDTIDTDLVVVHGVATGTNSSALAGVRFEHAWTEALELCFDWSNGQRILLPRDRYYAAGCINPAECRRYTRAEATALLVKHKHYGPWVPCGVGPPHPARLESGADRKPRRARPRTNVRQSRQE